MRYLFASCYGLACFLEYDLWVFRQGMFSEKERGGGVGERGIIAGTNFAS